MKSLLIALLWRIGIGIFIALVGIVVAAVTGRWNIDYWWFGGFGFGMIVLSVLPFMGGRTSTAETAWVRPESYLSQYKAFSKESFGMSNWVVSTFLIGIINLLTSVLMYQLHH